MAKIAEAKTLLETATTDCQSAKQIADRQGKFAAAKNRAAATLDQLNKLPADQKSLIAKELEQVASKLDSATAKAEIDKKPDEALGLLQGIQKQLDELKVNSDLSATLNSPAPNPRFIKLLMKESGGTKMLDGLVAQMDEKASRNVLEAALEARFDLDLQQYLSQDGITIGTGDTAKKIHGTSDLTAPDKSVKRIYELLLKVPQEDVIGKVQDIRRFQEDTGGAAYGWGEIDLNCGRSGSTTSSNQAAELCSPEFFPDGVDENCQPPDDAKNKEIQYFDWATIHEVGHAVDDKKSFMEKHQSKDEFGAWEVYKKDVTVPADAAQKHFKYDLTYITQRLKQVAPPPAAAAKPAGRDQKEWDQAKNDFDAWCDKVMALDLWWDGEGSKRVAIEGRVYQLAYDTPQWVSYKLEARKRGIHGYQFRAPGEWFAELYAAYYMGMLKPEHPAVKDWLPAALK